MLDSSSPMRRLLDGFAWAALTLSLACGGPDVGTDVVALFDGGEVTSAELERAILAQPVAARETDPAARLESYRRIAGQLAIRELLLAEAEREDLATEPEIAERLDEQRRQILVSALVRRELEITPPTAEEVEESFAAHSDRFGRPERREVYHIFLRPEAGESEGELRSRLAELRQRALDGEPFPLLAREHSQSQLRHGDGALGWVSRGQLPPRLEEIVFDLDEGVPSEILMTRSGAHLFLAATVIEARPPALEEARQQVRQQLQQERLAAAVDLYLSNRESTPGDYEPTREELEALLAGGDPNAVVLRVDDWALTAGELVARLEAETGGRPAAEGEAHTLLGAIAQGRRLLAQAEAEGLDREPELVERLAAAREALLASEMPLRVLRERVRAQPEVLEEFFAAERRRFAGPLRLRVARLALPVGRDSGRVMGELEAALPALRNGALTLEQLAERTGATVEEPVWRSLGDLRRENGQRGRLAAVAAGDFSEPNSTGRELELFHVLERSEPDLPLLDSVRDEVVEAYLEADGERIYEEFVSEQLQAANFEVVEPNLVLFGERAVGVARSDG